MNVQALSSALMTFVSPLPNAQNKAAGSGLPAEAGQQLLNEDVSTLAQEPATQEEVAEAMENLKQAVAGVSDMARNLQFSIDEDTGRTVVKIVDPDTKEIIRQIPSEQLLSIAKSLATSTGLLVKQQA